MCDTPFKTPLPYKTNGTERGKDLPGANGMTSDSDESVTSSNSDSAGSAYTQSSNGEISLVAEFDDFMRYYHQIRSEKEENTAAFLHLVEQIKSHFAVHFQALDECRRLQDALDVKTTECSDLDHRLIKARQLLDAERINSRNARKERDELVLQISEARELLLKDKTTSSRLSEDLRHKLSFFDNNNIQSDIYPNNGHQPQLSAIKEINSTGSLLSDFSYSRSEDDIEGSFVDTGKPWKKHRPSCGGGQEPAAKKRRSASHKTVEISASDTVRATTTLTVPKDGPITATSVIESLPKTQRAGGILVNDEFNPSAVPANLVFDAWARGSPCKPERKLNLRQHCFQQKTIVMPDTCGVCEKRIRFGKAAMKCKECKAVCHVECKDKLPLPCIPTVNTPTQRNILGVIGDYTPTTPPMVPSILIHCIREIEFRGLTEVGLYRVPGAEFDVKALKEKLLKGRNFPCLNQIDIHVICGTVKDFLRSLHEPLVTYGLWKSFVQAVDGNDQDEILQALYGTIADLPQPNRDTLAYMILHLQRISQAKECKMNVTNLAKIFGPTIVGYSSDDPNPNNLLAEMVNHNRVMEQLINIPYDYWSSFINIDGAVQQSRLQATPSTDSLLNQRSLFTPSRNLLKLRQKYFPSPKE